MNSDGASDPVFCPVSYRIFLPSGIVPGYMRPAYPLTLLILTLLIFNAGCTAPGPGQPENPPPSSPGSPHTTPVTQVPR
ncbi:MAG: hypothetical protein MUF37_04540, partial [Methanoregulaceae archaeon]|nr:hypothetical protein [Methanoregulaceae archaeon]